MVQRSYWSWIPADTIECGYFWVASQQWPVFPTFDGENLYHILNFTYCYKLSNKDICMLFNTPKQLKLMEIEVHI